MNEKGLDIQIERVNKAFHLIMDVKLALQSNNMPMQELAIDATWMLTRLENQLRDIKKG